MFLQLERKARRLFLCYKKPRKNLLSRLKVSGILKNKLEAEEPSTSLRILRRFLPSVLAQFVHIYTGFSKMVPRVNIFENAGFSFTCGRTKTEVFEYRGTVLIRSSMGKKKMAVLPGQGQIS